LAPGIAGSHWNEILKITFHEKGLIDYLAVMVSIIKCAPIPGEY
jgi:hypothetical protein